MPQTPIYMDHHATTPVDERVLRAMLPYFSERFGNAASQIHAHGKEARDAVEVARADVAGLMQRRSVPPAGEAVVVAGRSNSGSERESVRLPLGGAAAEVARRLEAIPLTAPHRDAAAREWWDTHAPASSRRCVVPRCIWSTGPEAQLSRQARPR